MENKKSIVRKLMISVLVVATLLTSNVTSVDVQAGTAKAKVSSFSRTAVNTAQLKFKSVKGATKYQIRYSFYSDFRDGFTVTTGEFKLPNKGKSRNLKEKGKTVAKVSTPKSGDITVKIQDSRLKKITYTYRKSTAPVTLDGLKVTGTDPRDYVYSKYNLIAGCCVAQVRYLKSGSWSAWSNVKEMNQLDSKKTSKFKSTKSEKLVKTTHYDVCNNCYFSSVSRETTTGYKQSEDFANHMVYEDSIGNPMWYSTTTVDEYQVTFKWSKQ